MIGDHLSPWVYITSGERTSVFKTTISAVPIIRRTKGQRTGAGGGPHRNNVIENVGGAGIYFNGYQSQIIGNNFYNIGTTRTNSYDMIDLDDCAGMLISGNKITGYGTTRDGVRIYNGTFESLIEANVFWQVVGSGVNIVGQTALNNTVGVNQYTNVGALVSNAGRGTIVALAQQH